MFRRSSRVTSRLQGRGPWDSGCLGGDEPTESRFRPRAGKLPQPLLMGPCWWARIWGTFVASPEIGICPDLRQGLQFRPTLCGTLRVGEKRLLAEITTRGAAGWRVARRDGLPPCGDNGPLASLPTRTKTEPKHTIDQPWAVGLGKALLDQARGAIRGIRAAETQVAGVA